MILLLALLPAVLSFYSLVGSTIYAIVIRKRIKRKDGSKTKGAAITCLVFTVLSVASHLLSLWLFYSIFKAFSGGNSMKFILGISAFSIPVYIFCLYYTIKGFINKPQNITDNPNELRYTNNKCPHCNSPLVNGSLFCTECGQKL